MTVREIIPVRGPLHTRITVPGSKSITNRALICAALAKGESVIRNASDSDDTALMVNGLNQFGVLVRKKDEMLIVEGTGGKLYAPKFPIPVGNAGTTLRFLLAVAALAQGTTTFEADPRMAERPNEELLDALNQLNVKAQQSGSRFMVQGGTLRGSVVTLSAPRSSQFVSSLLMIAPYAANDTTIRVERTSSSSYVDMTMGVMRWFGVAVRCGENNTFAVGAGGKYAPTEFVVEADATSASYFLAAAAVCGGSVFVDDLKLNSLQGDVKFADILRQMGCTITETSDGVGCANNGVLRGVDVDMNSMPDTVPTLAVVALFANSPTRIANVAHLRHKESDRLAALETELRKLGAHVTATDNALEIIPTQLHGAQFDTYDDHRLAMSFAVIGLRVQGVKIENPACVRKSFPRFWEEFKKCSTR